MDSRHFVIRRPETLDRALRAIAQTPTDGKWEIIVRPVKSKRSLQQNQCMWAINEEAGSKLGYAKGEFHELAKQAYQPYRTVERVVEWTDEETGEVKQETIRVPIPWSTSDLNVESMSRYLDWLVVFATDEAQIDARRTRRAYGE